MKNFWTVVSHTFLYRFQTKAFLISTIITMLLIVGLTNVDRLFGMFDEDETDVEISIQTLDQTNELYQELEELLAQADSSIALEEYTEDEETAIAEEEELLLLSYDENNLPAASFTTDREGMVLFELEQSLQQLKERYVLAELELEQAELLLLEQPVSFDVTPLTIEDSANERTEEEFFQAAALVYILLIMLYISVITYGSMIATDVAVEKSSRVMEILISSVSPVVQMFGKIIGIALLALVQVVLIGASAALGLFLRSMGGADGTEIINELLGSGLQIDLIVYAILYFILGYFLYASIAAMLGSLVSRAEDVNSMISPLIYLLMIAFFIAMFGLSTPESGLITVLSYIPFFTPMLMYLRVGLLSIPFWEIALSFLILIVSIFLVATLAARVYKGGVLMYGKAASFKDIKKAISLGKKE